MAGAADRVALGVIGRPHGVKGLVRIKPYTERPRDVAAYGPVELADGRRFAIEVVAEAKGMVTARLDEIGGAPVGDRAAAAALTGAEISVPRAALPAAGANEFYHHDLIGLAAVGVDGADLGRVVAVHDFGAGPVLEIGKQQGDPAPEAVPDTVMVPFTDEVVPDVDIEGGRLKVDAPPGLLDDGPEGEGPEDGND